MFQIRFGLVSITGNFRENNEDNAFVDEQGQLFLVADGMGGQCAGERASGIAADMLPQRLQQLVDFNESSAGKIIGGIDEAIENTNAEIMALGEVDPESRRMGTTVVFVLVSQGRFFVVGIGDSRAYQFSDSKLTQLTVDHSLTQALLEAKTITPEEAENHRYKNVLYRYLGTKEGSAGSNAREIEPLPGDVYVLCSDGVTDGISDDEIAALLIQHDDPQECAEALVRAAEDGGSKDNITCLILMIDPA